MSIYIKRKMFERPFSGAESEVLRAQHCDIISYVFDMSHTAEHHITFRAKGTFLYYIIFLLDHHTRDLDRIVLEIHISQF